MVRYITRAADYGHLIWVINEVISRRFPVFWPLPNLPQIRAIISIENGFTIFLHQLEQHRVRKGATESLQWQDPHMSPTIIRVFKLVTVRSDKEDSTGQQVT